MAKRLTDTEKWRDPWFRKLPCKLKNLWQYICDQCDNAGVWKVDMETAGYFIGEPIGAAEGLQAMEGRITALSEAYWLINKFVPFQYGPLSDESRPHKQVMMLIEKHRVSIGYPKGMHTLKDKYKDYDYGVEVKKGPRETFKPPELAEVEAFAKEKSLPLDAPKFFDHYASKGWMVGRNKMKDWKAAARLAAKNWAILTPSKSTQVDYA